MHANNLNILFAKERDKAFLRPAITGKRKRWHKLLHNGSNTNLIYLNRLERGKWELIYAPTNEIITKGTKKQCKDKLRILKHEEKKNHANITPS